MVSYIKKLDKEGGAIRRDVIINKFALITLSSIFFLFLLHKNFLSLFSFPLRSLFFTMARQTVSEAKLRKILELNDKLKEQLEIPRIPVSEASRS